MSHDPGAPGEHQQPGSQGWGGSPQYPGSPQPGWGAYPPPPGPPAAPPPGPAGFGGPQYSPGPRERGFFSALFDFSFDNFETPALVRVLYIIFMVLVGIGYVINVVLSFWASNILGVVVLIGGAIAVVFLLASFRLVLEFYRAVVRIAEDIHDRRSPTP